MFCQKCGFKLKESEEICSNCGNTVVATDSCGGFWGLVTQMDSAPLGAQPQNELGEKTRPLNVSNNAGQTEGNGMNRMPNNYNTRGTTSGAGDKLSGTTKFLVIASFALAFASLTICLILLISFGKTKKTIDELSERIDVSASSESYNSGDDSGSSLIDLMDNATEETTEDTTETAMDVLVEEEGEGTLTFEILVDGIDEKAVEELDDISIRVYNDDYDVTYGSEYFDADGKYIAVIAAGEYNVSLTGDGSNDKYVKDTVLLNGSPSVEKSVTIKDGEDTEFPIKITYKAAAGDKDSTDGKESQNDKTGEEKDNSNNSDSNSGD